MLHLQWKTFSVSVEASPVAPAPLSILRPSGLDSPSPSSRCPHRAKLGGGGGAFEKRVVGSEGSGTAWYFLVGSIIYVYKLVLLQYVAYWVCMYNVYVQIHVGPLSQQLFQSLQDCPSLKLTGATMFKGTRASIPRDPSIEDETALNSLPSQAPVGKRGFQPQPTSSSSSSLSTARKNNNASPVTSWKFASRSWPAFAEAHPMSPPHPG